MTAREIALMICEPRMNGDPCEGCNCARVCQKLIERIEAAIKEERKACAQIVEEANKSIDWTFADCAAAIRSRGNDAKLKEKNHDRPRTIGAGGKGGGD